MPPSDEAGWIHSDQLILPRQSLSKEEAEPFLSYVFGQLARKPKRLKLTETARVARYLKAIAAEMPGSPQRRMLGRLAEMIWLTLIELAGLKLRPSQKQSVSSRNTRTLTFPLLISREL